MKKISFISLIIVLVLFLSQSPMLYANADALNESVREDGFIQYDTETKEYSYYYPSEYECSQTWDLFSDEKVEQMLSSLNSFNQASGNEYISPRTIIGDEDTRIYTSPSSSPYCSVVVLKSYWDTDGDGIADDKPTTGTGFLVSGKILVTAAHCVVSKTATGGSLVELRIYPDVFTSNINNCSYVHPRSWTWSTNWHNTSIGYKYDYCVVELWDDITRPFYFNCVQSSNLATPKFIYISGYPGDHLYYQMTSAGIINSSDYYNCWYDNDTVGGMSGSPIYNNGTCFGIHTNGISPLNPYNRGVLFTPYLYNLICSKIAATE